MRRAAFSGSARTSCSQTLITRQPFRRSCRVIFLSRRRLPEIFSLQYFVLLEGIRQCLGQACQKTPVNKGGEAFAGKNHVRLSRQPMPYPVSVSPAPDQFSDCGLRLCVAAFDPRHAPASLFFCERVRHCFSLRFFPKSAVSASDQVFGCGLRQLLCFLRARPPLFFPPVFPQISGFGFGSGFWLRPQAFLQISPAKPQKNIPAPKEGRECRLFQDGR